MRLIDADEILTGIEEIKISPWATESYMFPHELAVKEALEIVRDLCVNQAPTVDAAPVVRCKDCLWSRKVDDREPKYTCKNICRYGCTQWLVSDDYCSYGEPKEGAYDQRRPHKAHDG